MTICLERPQHWKLETPSLLAVGREKTWQTWQLSPPPPAKRFIAQRTDWFGVNNWLAQSWICSSPCPHHTWIDAWSWLHCQGSAENDTLHVSKRQTRWDEGKGVIWAEPDCIVYRKRNLLSRRWWETRIFKASHFEPNTRGEMHTWSRHRLFWQLVFYGLAPSVNNKTVQTRSSTSIFSLI